MKLKKLADLNICYNEAEQVDREDFAEKRSNVQLVAGEHYKKSKLTTQLSTRIRNASNRTDDQKLRITKNHIFRLANHYVESILSTSPDVKCVPYNKGEMQDQKDAELNDSVWKDIKHRHRIKEKIRQWAEDFVHLGECAVKVSWDPMKGELLGYRPRKEDTTSEYARDENGELMPDHGQPVYSGDWDFERIYGFNLLRSPAVDSMEESPYLIVRKLVDTKELKLKYADDEEKLRFITESAKDNFVIFDTERGRMDKSKGRTLVRYHYYRPCAEYPRGYYYIATEDGILEQDELPFGIFPIVWRGFDENPTVPRGKSVIKRARPFQAEINRAISQQATHHVTLGSDKIIYQAGTKLSPGALLPGVRGITYQGAAPTILPGRAGEQFTAYIESQIQDMYRACGAEELWETNPESAQQDPWAKLFANYKQRRKYAKYGEKFEQFLIDVADLTLKLARHYLDDQALIRAAGTSELINVPEFKNSPTTTWDFKVEAQSEDLETLMGKQLSAIHTMQYVGKQLDKDSIGQLIRSMPFGNLEEGFEDLTLDYDNAQNLILALDRGQPMPVSEFDNADYMAKRLIHRMRKPDFRFKPPEIQQLYKMTLDGYHQELAKQEEKIQAAKNEYIPTDGPMVGVDMYVENEDPTKEPKRARLPSRAIEWLVDVMKKQGMSLEKLENMDKQNAAALADRLMQSQGQMAGPAPQGALPPAY